MRQKYTEVQGLIETIGTVVKGLVTLEKMADRLCGTINHLSRYTIVSICWQVLSISIEDCHAA